MSLIKKLIKSIMAYSIFFPVVETLSATSVALLVLYSIWSISYGGVDYGTVTTEMMSFILYISMLFRPIRMLADRFNTLQMGMVGSSRVFELIDSQDFIFQKDNLKPDGFKGHIKFDNVLFSYNEINPVFKGLSFTVNPGETVAIVGPTGAGKTSLINLISRYYEFQKGKITIDGLDIRNIDINTLRSKIAVVLQDVFLFNTTIREYYNRRFENFKKGSYSSS